MKKHLSQALRFALMLLALTIAGRAQTTSFTYQGSLTLGGTLANGGYDLQFKLYDQLSGGTLQGSPSTVTVSAVTVTAGVFSVELDFGATAFPGAARFLEISVRPSGSGGFTTLSPRQQLSSTPYAIRSLSAAGADNATNFSGSLSGDVTGTQSATVVSTVGGVTAGNVGGGATLANNATDANSAGAIVKRDASGNFTGGTITASAFNGSGANLTNLNASNIATGSLLDSLLSSNVAKLNAAQTFTANQTINANLIQSGTLVQFTPINGFVAGGTVGSGSIPATGEGVRMMWYPRKAAFRAGVVDNFGSSSWDDANIGLGSIATGLASKASGNYTVALGSRATASGENSVALGTVTTASGIASTALGNYASTNGMQGSFVYGDNSTPNNLNATATNQFNVRASGGLRFFASNNTSDETKPGLFISGTTGNTQINGNLTVSGVFSGSGSSLTSLNASNISSGTLSDSLLSSNVALLGSANTFTANQTVSANLIQSGTLVQFTPTNGFVAGGTVGSGSIPATGAGARLMWYPNKAALRAGQVSNTNSTYWDDAEIGIGSAAFGEDNRAGGKNSFAAGLTNTASGEKSVALGESATAGGERSLAFNGTAGGLGAIALGSGAQATEDDALALGPSAVAQGLASIALGPCTASGSFSTCIGLRTKATGNFSTVLGRDASSSSDSNNTTTYSGVIALGDGSTTAPTHTMYATANNQFNVRAAGGIRFFTACCNYDTGVTVSAGGGAWNSISDRNAKENFQPVAPRDILRRVLNLPISTWNYKAQNRSVRHIGAMAQDFYAAFNVGDDDKHISTIDPDGVALAAIQGLHEELKDRDSQIRQQQQQLNQLQEQVKQQQAAIDGLRQLLCAQSSQAELCRKR